MILKKLLLSLLAVLPLVTLSVPAKAQSQSERMEQAKNDLKKKDYIMNEASLDIAADVSLWVQLRGEVDAASGEGWVYSLSVKIPSQPLGVIEVMAQTGFPAAQLCIPRFIEAEDYVVDQWTRRSVAALESFNMVDEKREKIRRDCLESIKKTDAEIKARRALEKKQPRRSHE